MIIKIKNLFNYLLFLLIRRFAADRSIPAVPGTLLIIRLDAIGDYVLFRDYLKFIRLNERFKNFKITLCGNIIWKDLSEMLDNEIIDNFIWIDRKKFYANFIYKFSILKLINSLGFEVVVNPTYTREILYGDEIAWVSNAKEKIGSEGALDKYAKWKRNLISDGYYTRLTEAGTDNLFEFQRNKEFFEKWLNSEINLKKPVIIPAVTGIRDLIKNDFIAVFPSASKAEKRWNIENFAEACRFILNNYKYDIIITGAEIDVSARLAGILPDSRVINLTSRTTLPQLAEVISMSALLISNESVAVHLAAAVDKQFICISNGERLGRFHPYPGEIFDKAYYVYPEEIARNVSDKNFMKEAYRFSSSISINEINPGTVIQLISKLLK